MASLLDSHSFAFLYHIVSSQVIISYAREGHSVSSSFSECRNRTFGSDCHSRSRQPSHVSGVSIPSGATLFARFAMAMISHNKPFMALQVPQGHQRHVDLMVVRSGLRSKVYHGVLDVSVVVYRPTSPRRDACDNTTEGQPE